MVLVCSLSGDLKILTKMGCLVRGTCFYCSILRSLITECPSKSLYGQTGTEFFLLSKVNHHLLIIITSESFGQRQLILT